MDSRHQRRWPWWIAGAAVVLVALYAGLSIVLAHEMNAENAIPSDNSQMAFAAQSFPPGSAIYWLGGGSTYNDFRGGMFGAQTDGWNAHVVPPPESTNACVYHGVDLPNQRWVDVIVATYIDPATPPRHLPPYCTGGEQWTIEATAHEPNNEVVVIAFNDLNSLTSPTADQAAGRALARHLQGFPAQRYKSYVSRSADRIQAAREADEEPISAARA